MNVGDSLEDFGLSACGEEELATLEHTAQVAAVEGGPSQAKVAAAVVPVLIGLGAGVSCTYGLYKSAFVDDTPKSDKKIMEELFRETSYGALTMLGTALTAAGLEWGGVIAASSQGPMAAVVVAPIASYLTCKTGGNVLHYIFD